MRLARFYSLIIITCLFISSCAQVGTISGGEKDVIAPRPIEKNITPPNNSVNFNSKEVELPFDEFIKLNNPVQNIIMVPPHAQINASVKGKSLLLSWEEELKPNTTYSIYLNGAVRDITQGNDSIIQYVFSTGDVIDSLSYGAFVMDAVNQQPVADVTLALFDKETHEIVSFSKTETNGFAQLSYLQAGDYALEVFSDINEDLLYTEGELVAFKNDGTVSINSSKIDSIPFKIFKPRSKPRLRTIKYIPPSAIVFGSNENIVNESIYINGNTLAQNLYHHISADSIIAFIPNLEPSTIDVILKCDAFSDTTSLRINSSGLEVPMSLKFYRSNKSIAPSDTVRFMANDIISAVDKTLIKLFKPQDSTEIKDYTLNFSANIVEFMLNRDSLADVIFEFQEGAIRSEISNAEFHTARLKFEPLRKFGTINMDLSAYGKQVVLQVFKEGKMLQQIPVANPSVSLKLIELVPGKYTFRIVQDANNNQKWDTGNYQNLIQPEQIDIYSKEVDVRANWEINVPLVPAR